ncbi:hypothetical protein PMAYCL1PPCAC_17313, partial [Pristionchus mayeri]
GRGGGGRGGGGRGGGSRGGSRGSGSRGGSSGVGYGRSSSSSGGWGGRARVHTYRGGGGATHSAVPLITRASIGRSFFAPRTSSLLFMSAGGMTGMHMGRMMHGGSGGYHYRGQATQQNTQAEDAATLLEAGDDNSTAVDFKDDELIPQDTTLVIAHPELPVLVAPTLAYFWGSANLPKATNNSNCIEMKTANEHGMYSVCNVTTMNRCQRPSAEVPDFIGRNITFQDGTPVRELAWLCPASESCCEWECCDVTYEGEESWMEWSFVFVLVVFFLIVAFRRAKECLEERKLQRNVNRYQAGQPQRTNQ